MIKFSENTKLPAGTYSINEKIQSMVEANPIYKTWGFTLLDKTEYTLSHEVTGAHFEKYLQSCYQNPNSYHRDYLYLLPIHFQTKPESITTKELFTNIRGPLELNWKQVTPAIDAFHRLLIIELGEARRAEIDQVFESVISTFHIYDEATDPLPTKLFSPHALKEITERLSRRNYTWNAAPQGGCTASCTVQ